MSAILAANGVGHYGDMVYARYSEVLEPALFVATPRGAVILQPKRDTGFVAWYPREGRLEYPFDQADLVEVATYVQACGYIPISAALTW